MAGKIDISSLSSEAQTQIYLAMQGISSGPKKGGGGGGNRPRGGQQQQQQRGRGQQSYQPRGQRGGSFSEYRNPNYQYKSEPDSEAENTDEEGGGERAQRGTSRRFNYGGFRRRGSGRGGRGQFRQGGGNSDAPQGPRPPGPDSAYNVWSLADGISQAAWENVMKDKTIPQDKKIAIFKDRILGLRYFGHLFRSPMTMFRGFQFVKPDEQDTAVDEDTREKVKTPKGVDAKIGHAVWVFKTRYAIDPSRPLQNVGAKLTQDFFTVTNENRDKLIEATRDHLKIFDRIEWEGYQQDFEKAASIPDSKRPRLFKGYKYDSEGNLIRRGDNSGASTPGMKSLAGSEENLNTI